MRNTRFLLLLFPMLFNSGETSFADGKVFARPEVQMQVDIPNQQALIFHREGVQCLVIETAFLGEGTNFGWVVPLPSEPKVRPVSEMFFPSLQQAFQPRLLHHIHHYYLGVLFVCGLAFLAWRSLKDEVAWVRDLPLCLILSASVGYFGENVLIGIVMLIFTLATRLFIRSTTSFTVVVLAGMMLGAWMTVALKMEQFGLIQTMGSDGSGADQPHADVTVLSVQRAGVFDATTIRGTNSQGILTWLEANGFNAPKSIEPVVREYVERGWVFVASKAHRENAARVTTTLHPLSFTFATATPVYPLKLTGVDNGKCAVDLYVFGDQRAAASHFQAIRCDRLVNNMPDGSTKGWTSRLQLHDVEVLNCISNATIGTKLSAHLSPGQMKADAEITWRNFSSRGAFVYSRAGATAIAVNIGLPMAILGWLLVGASRGGWGVDDKFIARWRWRVTLVALVVGLGVYWFLPKVEIVTS